MAKNKSLDGPIPGENYLANTKNQPWHRPPDMADFVEIVETAIKKLNKPQEMGKLKVLLASGDTILDYVSGMLRIAIGDGKIPIDMAVLAAGPIARFVEVIAENGNFKFKRGWEQELPIPTVARAKAMYGDGNKSAPPPEVAPPPAPADKAGGFMPSPDAPASKDEQMAMLGQAE